MIKKSSLFAIILMLSAVIASAQTAPAKDVVMVLPFENKSGIADFNWVGETFADALPDLLKFSRFRVVSNQERKVMQLREGMPLRSIISRAASIRLAVKNNVALIISGSYRINSPSAEGVATVTVVTSMINVRNGQFVTEELKDGRSRVLPPLEVTDAVANLQKIQGELAYEILKFHEKELTMLSSRSFVEEAIKVPPKAFEAYTKGLLTTSPDARENYFKNAARIYRESTGKIYSEAELELGHIFLTSRKGNDALMSFERVISQNKKCKDDIGGGKQAQCQDDLFAEAAFYVGLLYLQQGKFELAISTLQMLTTNLKLTTTYNALGAISVQASRAETKDLNKSAAHLKEGLDYLSKAAESSPRDASIIFNYGIALFLNGDYVNATTQLENAIVLKATDGEAYFVLAKAREFLKHPLAGEADGQARALLTEANRYAVYATEWERTGKLPSISLRVIQPKRQDFVGIILSTYAAPTGPAPNEIDELLVEARSLLKAGKDEESLLVLRRVVVKEPMSADAYLLLGKIHLRRGDLDQAISSFKTSIFWDNRLIDAHVSLGKIYVEKGDCLQAKTYAASAEEIDKDNQDVLALQRLSERCSK